MTDLKTTVEVTEVFGKFAVEVNGEVELFDTEATAIAAGTLALNGEVYREYASAYCSTLELTEKQTKMQSNIIVSFLAFKDAKDNEGNEVEEEVEL